MLQILSRPGVSWPWCWNASARQSLSALYVILLLGKVSVFSFKIKQINTFFVFLTRFPCTGIWNRKKRIAMVHNYSVWRDHSLRVCLSGFSVNALAFSHTTKKYTFDLLTDWHLGSRIWLWVWKACCPFVQTKAGRKRLCWPPECRINRGRKCVDRWKDFVCSGLFLQHQQMMLIQR